MKIPLLFLCLTALTSCNRESILLDAEINNVVKAGCDFRIELAESHAKGHTWGLGNDFDRELVEYTSAVWHGEEKGIVFHFKARREGKTTLKLVKRMYKDTLESKQVNVEIVRP